MSDKCQWYICFKPTLWFGGLRLCVSEFFSNRLSHPFRGPGKQNIFRLQSYMESWALCYDMEYLVSSSISAAFREYDRWTWFLSHWIREANMRELCCIQILVTSWYFQKMIYSISKNYFELKLYPRQHTKTNTSFYKANSRPWWIPGFVHKKIWFAIGELPPSHHWPADGALNMPDPFSRLGGAFLLTFSTVCKCRIGRECDYKNIMSLCMAVAKEVIW